MLLYNLTLILESSEADFALERVKHFVQTLSSHTINLLKMLDSPHEGVTYCLQFQAQNLDEVQSFCEVRVRELRNTLDQLMPGKVLYFESMMEYL